MPPAQAALKTVAKAAKNGGEAMIRGLYTSALGMTTQMNKMDIISNNIANVNTTGYKKDGVITQSFSEELMKFMDSAEGKKSMLSGVQSVGKFSHGLFVDNIYTNFSNGSLKGTSGPLDCAVSGSGFFVIEKLNDNGEATEKYTRDGAFTIGAEGYLSTKDGDAVMGMNGKIAIPNGNISITDNGDVYVNSELIDRLKLVDFEDKTALRKEGSNLYSTLEGTEASAFKGKIEQGFLEASNVNSVNEMIELINISRTYEANQKMIQSHDSTLSKAVNEIGSR
ncbi:MAG: flagellar basal-body rod protein FlgF [Lachnospiraceae bacterium]|jgi:flagellar basal-body rod protein FlgG|nr:flagellar basal-body rod protein FlgF [Lachnospiraceae bacterium]